MLHQPLLVCALSALGDLVVLVGVMLDVQSIPESLWVNMLGAPPKGFSVNILGV